MAAVWVQLIIGAAILLPLMLIILTAALANRIHPPDPKAQEENHGADAHAEAVFYLGEVLLAASSSAPNPTAFRSTTLAILQISEYPGKGKVSIGRSKSPDLSIMMMNSRTH